MKKYRLLKSNTIEKYGRTLYKIKALCSFGSVQKGEEGGYIEKPENLSQEGSCWVGKEGFVFGDGIVTSGGVVWGGVVWGGVVSGGEVWGGEVRGGVVSGGEVWGGEVRGGVVSGGVVRGGVVSGGEVWGGEVRGGVVWGGVVRGGVVSGGEVSGGEVSGGVVRGGVVWGGIFEKTALQIQGSRHFVNISRPNHIKIGCHEYSFDYWKENFKKIGKSEGYSKEEIAEYGQYIEMAINFPNQPKES